MSQFRSIYAAALSAWWCCPDCEQAITYCPGCGEPMGVITRPANHPPALPLHTHGTCGDDACGVVLAVTVCGYRPNPTGDAPANRSPLSDPLPVAERPAPMPAPRAPLADFFNGETQPAQATPPQRTQAQEHAARYLRRKGYINTALDLQEVPRPSRAPRPRRQAPPPKPKPCPADATRYRLAAWGARDWLPDGVAPSAIAAAYCRVFGVPPRRDPTKRTARAYSVRELALALQDLGLTLGAMGLAPARQPAPGWEVQP